MTIPKKERVPIPSEVAAAVQLASDRTCCVCQERGKAIQLHHIDESPANSSAENLAVLCLECHNQTQLGGGFGRRLDASQVIAYRDDWVSRVAARRVRADELAVAAVSGPAGEPSHRPAPTIQAADYVELLPRIRRRANLAAMPGYDSGITIEMAGAAHSVIDVYEAVLHQLASYFPDGHFEGVPARDYFSEVIAQRARWHRALAEPDGVGTGGTIVGSITAAGVIADLESLIEDMAMALVHPGIDEQFDPEEWRRDGGRPVLGLNQVGPRQRHPP